MLRFRGSDTSRSSAKKHVGIGAALAALAAALISAPHVAEAGRNYYFGDVKTFGSFPADPGYPEGIAVDGNRVYVSGPARPNTAGSGPSKIAVYNRNSKVLEKMITVAEEDLNEDHALSCIAVDGQGRIYALSPQLGLLRFTKTGHGYSQEVYGALVDDLQPCVTAPPGEACSPVPFYLPPLPNDIVFDEAGYAYVTDSFQATIFRYPPGGGTPEIWFQSFALVGGGPLMVGANGIRLDPSREYVYFTVSTTLDDPAFGALYRLPLIDSPTEEDLELVHAYENGEAPDGFAFGASGDIYVTLVTTNEISVLNPGGVEVARIQSGPGSEIPLDAPANVAFDPSTKMLLIVNHAILSGNPDHFGVLRVWVNDTGDPLEKPYLP